MLTPSPYEYKSSRNIFYSETKHFWILSEMSYIGILCLVYIYHLSTEEPWKAITTFYTVPMEDNTLHMTGLVFQ